MANYDQHRDDENRDYRGRNSDSPNRSGNSGRDPQRGNQPFGGRYQQQDEDTRGKSGRYGYSGSSSDWDDDQRFRGGMERNYLAEGYDDSRYRNPGGSNQGGMGQRGYNRDHDYNSSSQSSRYSGSGMGSSYSDQDRSRRGTSGRSVLDTPNEGNVYGQQPYYSGSDPRSYGREGQYGNPQSDQYGSRQGQYGGQQGSSSYGGQQRGQYGSSQNQYGQGGQQGSMGRSRYEHDDDHHDYNRRDNRGGAMNRSQDYRGGMGNQGGYNQGAPTAGSYNQNFNDRDENSRYRMNRAPEDRHDDDQHRHEHRGIIGRITDWFSGDEDDHNDYRRR